MKNLQKKIKIEGILAILLLVFTVLFFGPCEIYAGSISDLKAYYGFGTLCAVMLALAVIVTMVLIGIKLLLPEKPQQVYITLLFAGGLLVYLQNMFFNGSLAKLDGDTSSFQNMKGTMLVNLLIWAAVIVVMIFLGMKKKSILKPVMLYGSSLLLLMQVVAFVFLLITTDFHTDRTLFIEKEDMFSVSEGKNVAVFVLDHFDSRYLPEVLAEKPELLEDLKGFTYYENTCGRYSCTFPAVPYLMTGEDYFFDYWYGDYRDQAFEKSEFLQTLKDSGFALRTYTELSCLGDSAAERFENVRYGHAKNSYFGIAKGMTKISLYRYLPYVLKQRFFAYTGDVQKMSIQESGYLLDDSEFYSELQTQGLTVQQDSGCFNFYHLMGAHAPYTLGADGTDIEGSTRNSQIEGCFTMINTYLDKLKEAGLYENTMVIITADHGEVGKDIVMHEVNTPVLYIKDFGVGDGEALRTSDAPMSHEKMLSWITSTAKGTELPELSDKTRMFYHVEQKNPDILGIREYEVTGDVNDFSNWRDTGIEHVNDENYY